MYDFLSGMTAAGFLVAALFFFRFWRRTRDALFAIFSLAFILFAINQAAFLPLQKHHENESWIYLFRLLGFLLLLLGIIAKNFCRRPSP
jgi:NADH:ubiquinone oxidoreductase subunit 3 (subunit A)